MAARCCMLLMVLAMSGCGPSQPPEPTVDENVQRKIDWMVKLAEAAEGPNQESDATLALEKFINVPFDAKSQPDAVKKIVDIYATRVRPKLRGEIAVEVAKAVEFLTGQSP